MIPLRDDNSSGITPVITWGLIAINVMIFLYQMTLDPRQGRLLVYEYGAIPAVILGSKPLPDSLAVIPAPLSLITNMFLHGGWLHLIGNMWYLWIFGDNIEAAVGRIRYLLFYILCGIIASFCHVLSDMASVIPAIGASGAISGILGAYALFYPKAKVLVLVPLFFFIRLMYIPAAFMLGFWFVLQLLGGSMSTAGARGGGVAFWAHIGGFLAGIFIARLLRNQSNVRPHFPSQRRQSG